MTDVDMIFDEREGADFTKIQNDKKRMYWQNQNAKRGHLGITRNLIGQLRGIRNFTGFTNDDQTLEYLLEIEKSLRDQNRIQIYTSCDKCGVPIEVKLGSYKGITHRHVDPKTNCHGSISTKYRIDTKTEVHPGTIETKVREASEITQNAEKVREASEITQNAEKANEIIRDANREKDTKEPRKKKPLTINEEEDEEEAIKNMDRDEFDKYITSGKSYLDLVDDI